VTVSAPPRPPDVGAPDDLNALEALIEEARRRARRRRQLYGASALVAAALGAGVFFGFRDGGGGSQANPGEPLTRISVVADSPAARNGSLTIMDTATTDAATGAPAPAGWYGLSTIGPDGGLHPLARCPAAAEWCGEVESLDWSPDGKWLAVAVTSFARPNPYNGVHLVNPATGEDLQVRNCRPSPGECDWFDLDWSPNGASLAYTSGGKISVLNFSVVYAGREVGSASLGTGTAGRDSSPSWSPDGKLITYASNDGERSSVYVIGADGAQRRLLTRDASYPAWSPDGARIAYRRGCGIRQMTPAGVDVTPFALSGCLPLGDVIPGPPVWSPDGRKITFGVSWSVGQERWRGTYVMNADGSHLTRLTTKARGVYAGQQPRPAWQPLP
jgi:hypothetical protein